MFVAFGSHRVALDDLAGRMASVATDSERVRQLVAAAEDSGFEFDD
ncbi:hypothetical protein ACIA5C_47995 [Actinoplanes sp. NPDC051343]